MTLYLDTCALNRLTDDLSHPRIRSEAEAVVKILELVIAGRLRWIASTILRYEIERNSDPVRRLDTLRLLALSAEVAAPSPETHLRASQLILRSFGPLDALHLAVAEEANVDWLVTTDDRFLNLARKQGDLPRPELINPVDFLQRRHPWLLPHPSPSAS